jgi:hypothetical protein
MPYLEGKTGLADVTPGMHGAGEGRRGRGRGVLLEHGHAPEHDGVPVLALLAVARLACRAAPMELVTSSAGEGPSVLKAG